MSKSNQASAYEADAMYRVSFKQVVMHGSLKYRPRDTPTMRGDMLNSIVEEYGSDAIRRAEAV